MKTINNFTVIWFQRSLFIAGAILVFAVGWGCESSTSGGDPPILDPPDDVKQKVEFSLNQIRESTANYHNVREAEQSGFILATSFVPYMGYHYVDLANLADGEVNILQPEALVYSNSFPSIPNFDPRPTPPLLDDELRLVAVEYLLPGTGAEEKSQLPDVFEGDDDQWLYSEADGVWTLHAWIWFSNPMGVFHPTNPLVGTESSTDEDR